MTLQARLQRVRELAQAGQAIGLAIPPIPDRHHIDIAVVGEIKRGKSTFLNAIMGAKIFPSRAMVCTSAVTVLLDGPERSVTVKHKSGANRSDDKHLVPDGTDVFDVMMALVAKPQKRKDGIQGNPEVASIDEVVVTVPNKYATDGIRLVDTPGVNDPDSWREEITYTYLGRADAAIMLLDPQQPLSQSEVTFLRDKVQSRVKHQLIFVLNKADQVRPEDLEASMARIRRCLSEWVPNPVIYPVAAKLALDAATTGAPQDPRWTAFTADLDTFLRKGRAGQLLLHRVIALEEIAQREVAILDDHLRSLDQDDQQSASHLNQQHGEEQRLREKLICAEQEAKAWLLNQRPKFSAEIRRIIAESRANMAQANGDVSTALNHFRREISDHMETQAAVLAEEAHQRFAKSWGSTTDQRLPALTGNLAIGDFSIALPALAASENSGFGAGLGAFIGAIVAGPVGMVLGAALLGGMESNEASTAATQNLAWYRSHIQAYLSNLEQAVDARSDAIVQAVSDWVVPSIQAPLLAALDRQSIAIAEGRRLLAADHADRTRSRVDFQNRRRNIVTWQHELTTFRNEIFHG